MLGTTAIAAVTIPVLHIISLRHLEQATIGVTRGPKTVSTAASQDRDPHRGISTVAL